MTKKKLSFSHKQIITYFLEFQRIKVKIFVKGNPNSQGMLN